MTARSSAAVLLAASVVMLAVLAYVGRWLTFWSDEWTFIFSRSEPRVLLRGSDVHLHFFPVLIYQVLFRVVGLSSYYPYLLVTWTFHLASVWLLFAVGARLAGWGAGLTAALSLLFLGSAFEVLLQPGQMGYALSVATGLLALFLLAGREDPPPGRVAWLGAATALCVSVTSSGVGMIVAGLVVVWAVLDRQPRLLAAAVPSLALYAAWFPIWSERTTDRLDLTLGGLAVLPLYVAHGIGATVVAVAGLPPYRFTLVGVALALVAGVVTRLVGVRFTRRPPGKSPRRRAGPASCADRLEPPDGDRAPRPRAVARPAGRAPVGHHGGSGGRRGGDGLQRGRRLTALRCYAAGGDRSTAAPEPRHTVSYQAIRLETRDAVATVTLDRPDVLNAMNNPMRQELHDAFTRLLADRDVKVIVVAGAGGRAFSAGADIREFLEPPVPTAFREERRRLDFRAVMDRCPQPIIAAIRGFALGGGLELALACDIRVAADDAVLGLTEVNIGIIPGGGGTQRLPRLVGRGKALEMILTGMRVPAQEALRIGLVERVVPAADLMTAAGELARAIADKAPIALRYAKEAVVGGLGLPLADGIRLENDLATLLRTTEDRVEGARAFVEKRKPRWQGR